jgi:hypothetical protein
MICFRVGLKIKLVVIVNMDTRHGAKQRSNNKNNKKEENESVEAFSAGFGFQLGSPGSSPGQVI